MFERLYRNTRRLLRPVHPNRLRYYVHHSANLLGILPAYRRFRVRFVVFGVRLSGLRPRRVAKTARWFRDFRAVRHRRRLEPRLTVAVDISAFWEPLTGIGWYLYRLLEHCAERDDVRLRLYGPNLIETSDVPRPVIELPRGLALEVVTYEVPDDLTFDYVWLVNRLRHRDAELIADDGNQVLFAPNYFLPERFDRCRGSLVATVHDLSFHRVPWTMRESTREDLAKHLERTAKKASRVLTDSETVLGELVECGLADPERAHAVHLGPGSVATADPRAPLPPGTPGRYVLHVGTLEPRKNLATLIAAWRLLRDRGFDAPPLVFCGHFGWKTEDLRLEMERAAGEGWLHHFGYVEDDQVAALYRHARLVALPSLYEGFGLPAIEAMSAGAPLVMSDIPVLREVGRDAAIYVSPEDPAAWADALAAALDDEALLADLAARGRERAKAFDWSKTAEGTIEVWKKAAGT